MEACITKRIASSANNAPAVRYPVGRSSFQGYFLLVFAVTGVMVGGLWIHAVPTLGSAHSLYFAVLIGVVALAGHAWRETEAGELAWGGESWVWATTHHATTGSMAVHLDVQFLMVLTLKDDRGRFVWLWAERAADPAGWRALRRALYADKQTPAVKVGTKDDAKTEVSL